MLHILSLYKARQEKTGSSFPDRASQGLLSLLLVTGSSFPVTSHRVFFPCYQSTGSSFSAGASHGRLSLLVLYGVFFPC